jgi:hypothetical protein
MWLSALLVEKLECRLQQRNVATRCCLSPRLLARGGCWLAARGFRNVATRCCLSPKGGIPFLTDWLRVSETPYLKTIAEAFSRRHEV